MTGVRLAWVLCASGLLCQQPPVFKSAVEYVEVNAVVTTKSGALVRDLTRDDFVVLENGKPQTLSAFATVDIPRDFVSGMPTGPGASPAISPPQTPDGRTYLIVLDVMHVTPARTPLLRARAKDFIDQFFGPSDLGAIAQIGYPDAGEGFTSDKAALVRAVYRAIGEKTGSAAVAIANADAAEVATGAAVDRESGARQYMAERSVFELTALVNGLGTMHSPRKALVLFGEGLDVEYNRADSELLQQVQRLFAGAARSNVPIYTVDPSGVASIGDDLMQARGRQSPTKGLYSEQRIAQASLRNFAEETGGLAWVGSSDFARGFKQIVDDNSSYYVLGYYSTDSRQDGKYRALNIKVNRKGLSVRARKGYYASSPGAR